MSTTTVPTLIAEIETLRRREKALAAFGTFAFRTTELQPILDEAARVCALSLNVPFCKVCQYRPDQNDLLVVAGQGWQQGVIGVAISIADTTSPQGLAFTTGLPQLCPDIEHTATFTPPAFYAAHGICSTADVLVAAKTGPPFGVLEADSQATGAFDEYDIDFLTGFANILAEAVATTIRAEELRLSMHHMEELIAQQDTFSQELKHRVRNNLHLIYALLTAEVGKSHDDSARDAFRSIAMRVMGLAQIFDHLLGIGMSRIIDLGAYLSGLCDALPELYQGSQVTLTCHVDSYPVKLDDATALGIAVSELVHNAYTHAFPGRSGQIAVTLRTEADHATLTVADNGIGFVESATTRHGMTLVRRLVQQAGAALTREAPPGTTWTLALRPTPPEAPQPTE